MSIKLATKVTWEHICISWLTGSAFILSTRMRTCPTMSLKIEIISTSANSFFCQGFMYRDPKGCDRDWPTLRSGHGLIEESLRRVLFTDSLWEAGQVGVELPQDVCRPQAQRRSEEPKWRFNGYTGLMDTQVCVHYVFSSEYGHHVFISHCHSEFHHQYLDVAFYYWLSRAS